MGRFRLSGMIRQRSLSPSQAAEVLRRRTARLQNPSPYRFVGDAHTALPEQIFDVAIAERETHLQPNGVPDDRRRNYGGQTRSSCAILPDNRTRADVRMTTPVRRLEG